MTLQDGTNKEHARIGHFSKRGYSTFFILSLHINVSCLNESISFFSLKIDVQLGYKIKFFPIFIQVVFRTYFIGRDEFR